MNPAIQNLMRVTGMGSHTAEIFLKGCSQAEVAMIAAGDVQAGMDAKANRKDPPKMRPGSFVPLSERKARPVPTPVPETPLPAGKPAASPSAPVSEAGTVEDDPDLP